MAKIDKHNPRPGQDVQELSTKKRALAVRLVDSRDPNRRSDFDVDKFLSALNSLVADGDFVISGYGKFFQLGTSETCHLREDLLNARLAKIEVVTGVLDRGNNRTSATIQLWEDENKGTRYIFTFNEDGTYVNHSNSNFQKSKAPALPDSEKKKLGT